MSTAAKRPRKPGVRAVEVCSLEDALEDTFSVRWANVEQSRFKYIDLTSVDRATHTIRDTATIDRLSAPSRAQQVVREGDVLFGTTRPLLRRYCLIPRAYDGQICSTGFCVLRSKPGRLLPNYLFHLLGTDAFYSYVEANQRGASYPSISDRSVKGFRIPLPPLEVQREIVRVLDGFTDLNAMLESELEARLRQYQHYRDSLLSFDGTAERRQWRTLGDVGHFIRGRRFTVADFVESGVGCIHYGEVYTHYGLFASTTKSFLRPELAEKLRLAKTGDLIIAATGENVEEVCKAVAWLGANDVAVHDDCYIFRHSLDPKYAAHFFQTSLFNSQKVKYAAGAKMTRVPSDSLAKVRIPVPSLAEQRRIVGILDHFEFLVKDVSVGIPAELTARRQQYEYYRDRLLSFTGAA